MKIFFFIFFKEKKSRQLSNKNQIPTTAELLNCVVFLFKVLKANREVQGKKSLV